GPAKSRNACPSTPRAGGVDDAGSPMARGDGLARADGDDLVAADREPAVPEHGASFVHRDHDPAQHEQVHVTGRGPPRLTRRLPAPPPPPGSLPAPSMETPPRSATASRAPCPWCGRRCRSDSSGTGAPWRG